MRFASNILMAVLFTSLFQLSAAASDFTVIPKDQAISNVKKAERTTKGNCKLKFNSCIEEMYAAAYNSVSIQDYNNAYFYLIRIRPDSEVYEGADSCAVVWFKGKTGYLYQTLYMTAFAITLKKLGKETEEFRKNFLDYSYVCFLFRSQNGLNAKWYTSQNPDLPNSPEAYAKEAAAFGAKAAADYRRFYKEIATPYFDAYHSFQSKGKAMSKSELSEFNAKVYALTSNALKAVEGGKYPHNFVRYLAELKKNTEILTRQSVTKIQ